MSLPSLTWVESEDLVTGSTPANLLSSIVTLITASTYWEVEDSGTEYVLIKPKDISNIPDFRALIVGKNSGSPAAPAILSPHDAESNILYIGIAPDGKGTFAGTWDVANPTGSLRWSKYWKCATTTHTQMYLLESEEIFKIVFYASDVNCFALAGAWLEPTNDDEGEGTPGRLYGMCVSGSESVTSSFLESVSGSYGGNASSSSVAQCGIFRTDGVSTEFLNVQRMTTYFIDDIGASGWLTTFNNRRVHLPIPFRWKSGLSYFAGVARQIKVAQNITDKTRLLNSVGDEKAIIFAAKRNSLENALAFEQP